MSNRRPRPMTPAEVHAFLDSKPGWMILTSIGVDGYPHSVPLGYFRVGDTLCTGCHDHTQKVLNIERNPKVSALVETSQGSHLQAVMLQGEAEVVREDAERLVLARLAAGLRGVPEAELPSNVRAGSVYLRIRPQRVLSWEYS